jgi:hypothetical protein
MILDPRNKGSTAQKSEKSSSGTGSTRRNFMKELGATATALGLAGCTGQDNNHTPEPETKPPEENNTENQQEPEQEYLSGIQLHDNWIHGEDGDVGNSFGVSEHGISLDDVTKELESADNRIDGIVSAIKVASSQHRADDYEGRHRHIVSAVDQGIDRLDDELWDFDLLSNMNYTQTVGETIQYSEIILPKEENDHSDIEIINAALKRDYNNAIHKPGEINTEDQFYKHTMAGVRDSENDGHLPPHDVEAIQGRVDRGAEESFFASGAKLMGYQLFAGGHEVNNGFEYNPDQMLVPANKEVHELIDDVKYENGDMSLNLAVNEKYFNEGYDEFEGPVSVDIKNTENDWDITLEKRPEWNHEQGYPEETA